MRSTQTGGDVFWLFCDFPYEWRDVKWMAIEEKHPNAKSPAELFQMLEDVHPHTGDGFLRPLGAHEVMPGKSNTGAFKVTNAPLLMSMPRWSWNDMLSFAKAV